jgi:hypothetical protein
MSVLLIAILCVAAVIMIVRLAAALIPIVAIVIAVLVLGYVLDHSASVAAGLESSATAVLQPLDLLKGESMR